MGWWTGRLLVWIQVARHRFVQKNRLAQILQLTVSNSRITRVRVSLRVRVRVRSFNSRIQAKDY